KLSRAGIVTRYVPLKASSGFGESSKRSRWSSLRLGCSSVLARSQARERKEWQRDQLEKHREDDESMDRNSVEIAHRDAAGEPRHAEAGSKQPECGCPPGRVDNTGHE